MTGPGPVLLCFDGSPAASDAICRSRALLAGRDALVLTVAVPAADELLGDPVGDLVGRISGLYREWDQIGGELAERQADEGCRIATEAGFNARPLTGAGKTAATILRVADEHDVAVIVLGAGRRGAVKGLLGSVSARVVHLATRPVLVIPGR